MEQISLVGRLLKRLQPEKTNDFYPTYVNLTTDITTLFEVLIFVVIVVGLSIAIINLIKSNSDSGGMSAV